MAMPIAGGLLLCKLRLYLREGRSLGIHTNFAEANSYRDYISGAASKQENCGYNYHDNLAIALLECAVVVY